ncbi:MAG: hypothetical protein ISQ29_00585 [Candidatus Puniceispirillum sp.]|jgi:hypothetical protein|nr:hypothetical protein [Candidatus Puniceispirillum sp.]
MARRTPVEFAPFYTLFGGQAPDQCVTLFRWGVAINFQDGWQAMKFAQPSQRKQAKSPRKTSTSQRKLKIGITPQNIWK